MDRNKLIELLKDAWNDGMSQYQYQYKEDLENFIDNSEDVINELCGGECSHENSGLNIPVIKRQDCMNLNHRCTGFDNGKCKMTKAKCVFQQGQWRSLKNSVRGCF